MNKCIWEKSLFIIYRKESKMNQPLVSVVIPTYKRPLFLERCIDSVLFQTYKNIEVFVVDDNNPCTKWRSETEKLMKKYEKDIRVTYIKHEYNKNGSAARNTGWRQATGDYITFIDDDDEIAPSKIERQVICLKELDETWGACYTAYKIVKENGHNQVSSENRSGDCYVDALMRTMFMGSGSNLLLRKKVVDEISGYDESFERNQDIEFLVRVLEHYKLAYIDEVLLTIYQEGERQHHTFEQVDGYALNYLNKFKNRIESLGIKEKERVYAVISLERFRMAIYYKKFLTGISILKSAHVKKIYILRYIRYLAIRCITKKSYGFDGF